MADETTGQSEPVTDDNSPNCPHCGEAYPSGFAVCPSCKQPTSGSASGKSAIRELQLAAMYDQLDDDGNSDNPSTYERLLTANQGGFDWRSLLPFVVFGIVFFSIVIVSWRYLRFANEYPGQLGQGQLVASEQDGMKECAKCGKAVPSRLTAGEVCPQCGVVWVTDRTLIDPNDPLYRSSWGSLWYIIPAALVIAYIFMRMTT